MTDPTQGLPPAGWYPDPAGAPQQRWWDGLQWTDNLQQATPLVEPQPTSQPISQPTSQPISQPIAFPFEPVAATPEPARSRRATTPTNDAPDATVKTTGRLHALALLVIGLITSIGGLALFLYGLFGTANAETAAQNELYGGIIAGFGAFAMLLWLTVGAIRQR